MFFWGWSCKDWHFIVVLCSVWAPPCQEIPTDNVLMFCSITCLLWIYRTRCVWHRGTDLVPTLWQQHLVKDGKRILHSWLRACSAQRHLPVPGLTIWRKFKIERDILSHLQRDNQETGNTNHWYLNWPWCAGGDTSPGLFRWDHWGLASVHCQGGWGVKPWWRWTNECTP